MKLLLKLLCVISPFFLTAQSLKQESAYDLMMHNLDSIIKVGIDQHAFPGANVLVLHKGEILVQKAYGYRTYDQKTPIQLDDIYDMASVSKITTGLPVLMKLYGEGKFDLDKPLGDYLPFFDKSNKGHKTYRDILAHRAQLIPHISYWQNAQRKNGKWKWRTFKSKESKRYPIKIGDDLYMHHNYKSKMMEAIKDSELLCTKEYKYSGLGFYLMPDLISSIVQENFETYLQREIYTKIGASTLTYNPLNKFDKSRIVPTEYDGVFRRQQLQGTVHDEGAAMMGGVSCNAGLFGNAEDLSKLMQLYLDKGMFQGEKIIDSTVFNTFTSYTFEGNRRGLGFDKPPLDYVWGASYVAQSASPESYGHAGYTGTFVWVDPTSDLIFIFLSNRVFPTRNNRNLYKLDIRPSLHQFVYDYLESDQ